MEKKIAFKLAFIVRNDKSRGILIESFKVNVPVQGGTVEDEFLFKYQDQPFERHSVQIQNIIRSAKVLRTKNITIDVTPFLSEYFHKADKSFRFKGTKLISVNHQNLSLKR